MIDWNSSDSLALLNPRIPEEQAARLKGWLRVCEHLQGHVFLLTSGSSASSESQFKWVALSKEAILHSAAAVNRHLESNGSDRWLQCLPEFHIGGLSIQARASLTGAEVVPLKLEKNWDVRLFAQSLEENEITLCSLVPTQIYDLVQSQLRAPGFLRALLVGGGALTETLYREAQALGWPLLPTYGMTETASQVATAVLSKKSSELQVLPHLQVRTQAEGRLEIRGPSLLSGYVVWLEGHPVWLDPKDSDGWFLTEDLGEVSGTRLQPIGRLQERIKIGGELSNLGHLRKTLEEVASSCGLALHLGIIAQTDERLESVIELIAEAQVTPLEIQRVTELFNQRVLPFERIRSVRVVGNIPRTELGKPKWGELSLPAPSPSPSIATSKPNPPSDP